MDRGLEPLITSALDQHSQTSRFCPLTKATAMNNPLPPFLFLSLLTYPQCHVHTLLCRVHAARDAGHRVFESSRQRRACFSSAMPASRFLSISLQLGKRGLPLLISEQTGAHREAQMTFGGPDGLAGRWIPKRLFSPVPISGRGPPCGLDSTCCASPPRGHDRCQRKSIAKALPVAVAACNQLMWSPRATQVNC